MIYVPINWIEKRVLEKSSGNNHWKFFFVVVAIQCSHLFLLYLVQCKHEKMAKKDSKNFFFVCWSSSKSRSFTEKYSLLIWGWETSKNFIIKLTKILANAFSLRIFFPFFYAVFNIYSLIIVFLWVASKETNIDDMAQKINDIIQYTIKTHTHIQRERKRERGQWSLMTSLQFPTISC